MLNLDANATTAPAADVVAAMLPWLSERHGNPSSGHAAGRRAARAVNAAREQVAMLIHARAEEIVFTSGATESINSVLLFAQQEWPERPRLIISRVEHAAVVECAARWRRLGGEVEEVPVDGEGRLDLEALRRAVISGRTALVSLIWANNETGVVTPMAEAVAIAHQNGALVHADAVQVAGKMPIDVQSVPVDYLSLSAHKMQGPPGVGALYIQHQAPFRPLLVGGGQEQGRRSGTENVPGIVGFGKAAELARQHLSTATEDRSLLRVAFENKLRTALPDLRVHGTEAERLPNTSSIAFPGIDAAGLLILLDQKGIACSGGSACHSAVLHPSHVLEAMGFSAEHAARTLRFSWTADLSAEDLDRAAEEIIRAARRLRDLMDRDSGPVSG